MTERVVVKDEVGPVSSGQTPLLLATALSGLLLPAGAQPLWLVPWGRGKSEHKGGRSDGDLEMVGGGGSGCQVAYAFSAHFSAPNLQGPPRFPFFIPAHVSQQLCSLRYEVVMKRKDDAYIGREGREEA